MRSEAFMALCFLACFILVSTIALSFCLCALLAAAADFYLSMRSVVCTPDALALLTTVFLAEN